MSLSTNPNRSIDILVHLDEVMTILREADGRIGSSHIQMFFKVAKEPGLLASDYARQLGVYDAIASRLLRDLGDNTREGEGYGLLEDFNENSEITAKQYRVTQKGNKCVDQFLQAFGR